MSERWIECPQCHTGYQAHRIGVSLAKTRQITIVCQVCKQAFDANVVVTTTWEQKSRWSPLREEVTTTKIESKLRGA